MRVRALIASCKLRFHTPSAIYGRSYFSSSLVTPPRGLVHRATSLLSIMAYQLVREVRSRAEGYALNYPARVTHTTLLAPSPTLSPLRTLGERERKTSKMKRRMRVGSGRVRMILSLDMCGTCARVTRSAGSFMCV